MSRSYACNQFERNYSAVRLCNWEVPADRACPLKPTSIKPPAKTEFITSDNGHLLGRTACPRRPHWRCPSSAPAPPSASGGSGRLCTLKGRGRPTGCSPAASKAADPTAIDHSGRKLSTSFVTGYDAMQTNRWPDNRVLSGSSYGGGATMGFR
jgi:hypothetical protein